MSIVRRTLLKLLGICALISPAKAITVIAGHSHSNVPNPTGLPSGAIGTWYADQAIVVGNAITVVPNQAAGVAAPNNDLIITPRRGFDVILSQFNPSNVVRVALGLAAPDGSTDAGSLTMDNSGAWALYAGLAAAGNLATGSYRICCWVKLISGTGTFKFGQPFVGTWSSAFTPTSTWTRYSATISYSNVNDANFAIGSDVASGTFTIAIIDFNIFAGTSDLGTTPLAGHIRIPNKVTLTGNLLDCTTGFTAGFPGQAGMFQWPPPAVAYGAGVPSTTLCCFQRSVADIANDFDQCWWSVAEDEDTGVGPNGLGGPGYYFGSGSGGHYYGETQCEPGTDIAGGHEGSLYNYTGAGLMVGAVTWNGTNMTAWINGVKVLGSANSGTPLTNTTSQDYYFNAGQHMDHLPLTKVSSLVIYNRALGDSEVIAGTNFLKARLVSNGNALATFKWTAVLGDQVAAGPWPFITAEKVTGHIRGAGYAYDGASLFDGMIAGTVTRAKAIFSARLDTNEMIVLIYFGRGDIGTGAGSVSAALTALASIHDGFRSLGIKTIACTLIDAAYAPNQSQFNTDRASFNSTVSTWTGVHANAVVNLAGVSGMGANGNHTNATNFQTDGITPTAVGAALLATPTATAYNGL